MYTYLPSTDINAGNIAYVTLLGISDGELTPIEQVHLVYYGNSSSNGLPGDLQMASVEYPDGSGTPMAGESGNWYGWTDDSSGPTAYFRYYTATTMSGGTQIGFAHGLRNALLPVAYSGLASYAAANDGGQVDQVPDSVADTYTCYYFQYDANCRVSKESVYGQTGTWSFTTQLATSSTNSNVWQRKTVTTEPDGATSTVYTNYIGETMLTDLHDPLTGTEAITYNRYDGNGNLLWTAEPSAFQKAGGVYYNQSFTDLIGYSPYGSARPYDGTSQFLKPNAGQFDVNQYYATTGTTNLYNQSNPPSLATSAVGGGVAGYLQASGVQQGSQGEPDWQTSLDYIGYTAGGTSGYFTFDSTEYQAVDSAWTGPTPNPGSDAGITEYRYTFYADSQATGPTIASETTISPAIQNGTGGNATTIDWYDPYGNLTWSLDGDGYLTLNQYDATTGQLLETVQNVNTAVALPTPINNPLDPYITLPHYPTNPSVPVATPVSDTANLDAQTDYSYDPEQRLTQTLGPVREIVTAGEQSEWARTASWTVYDDALQTTCRRRATLSLTPPTMNGTTSLWSIQFPWKPPT